jgi:hypothetical protein
MTHMNNASMIIERDIPIPKRKSVVSSKYEYWVAKLETGDSIGFPTRGQASAFAFAMKKRGLLPVIRKMGPNEFRVWRDG